MTGAEMMLPVLHKAAYETRWLFGPLLGQIGVRLATRQADLAISYMILILDVIFYLTQGETTEMK